MATPTTKATLKEWCLRRLGKPVVEINVDDDQVDDRLDEAQMLHLSKWLLLVKFQPQGAKLQLKIYP